MAKAKLEELSVEQLKAKRKSLKLFIGLFLLLIVGLFYFIIRDYLAGNEIDWSIFTIAVCTIGGPATLYPDLQEVRKELTTRNHT